MLDPCYMVVVGLTQVWPEEGGELYQIPPSDWPVLHDYKHDRAQPAVGSVTSGHAVFGYVRKRVEQDVESYVLSSASFMLSASCFASCLLLEFLS